MLKHLWSFSRDDIAAYALQFLLSFNEVIKPQNLFICSKQLYLTITIQFRNKFGGLTILFL